MEIFTFAKHAGRGITQFDSTFIMTKIVNTESRVHISCMHLDKGGIVGFHPAGVPQLLLVVQGAGRVRANEGYIEVGPGDAVFWNRGEGHETISEKGMMAIVLEAETLEPKAFMKKIST